MPALVSAPEVRVEEKTRTSLEAVMHVMKHYEMLNLKLSAILLRHDPIVKNYQQIPIHTYFEQPSLVFQAYCWGKLISIPFLQLRHVWLSVLWCP